MQALRESSWISDRFTAQVLASEKFKFTRSPSIIFCFVSPIPTRLEHSLAMSLEERERKENNKTPAASVSTTNAIGRVCDTCLKSTSDRNVIFFLWFLESFRFLLVLHVKSTGLPMQIQLGKIDKWRKLTGSHQSQSGLCSVCWWRNSCPSLMKIRVFYSKMKTRNQRVTISLPVSHPLCDLIKGYSLLPTS